MIKLCVKTQTHLKPHKTFIYNFLPYKIFELQIILRACQSNIIGMWEPSKINIWYEENFYIKKKKKNSTSYCDIKTVKTTAYILSEIRSINSRPYLKYKSKNFFFWNFKTEKHCSLLCKINLVVWLTITVCFYFEHYEQLDLLYDDSYSCVYGLKYSIYSLIDGDLYLDLKSYAIAITYLGICKINYELL